MEIEEKTESEDEKRMRLEEELHALVVTKNLDAVNNWFMCHPYFDVPSSVLNEAILISVRSRKRDLLEILLTYVDRDEVKVIEVNAPWMRDYLREEDIQTDYRFDSRGYRRYIDSEGNVGVIHDGVYRPPVQREREF